MKPQDQQTAATQNRQSSPTGDALPPVAAAANKAKTEAEPAQSTLTENGGRLDLVNPIIKLGVYVFLDPKDGRTQTKTLAPAAAYVENGLVVIEEYGMAMPIASIEMINFGKKVAR